MTLTRASRPRPARDYRDEMRDALAGRHEQEVDFLFQVESLAPDKHIELTIDTRARPGLAQTFEGLFNAARSSVDAQSARILKELVG